MQVSQKRPAEVNIELDSESAQKGMRNKLFRL